MKFAPVPVAEAVGALAAHSLREGDLVLRKGTPISAEAAAGLQAAGIDIVVAVRLEPDDVGENAAALRLAEAAAGPGVRVEPPFTGRANLYAEGDGILVVAAQAVSAINEVDESITLATLPAYKPVVAGEMIGTVKIIPYAVPQSVLDRAAAVASGEPILRVAPYSRRRIGVVSTLAPGLKPSVVAKTLAVLARRLEPAGAAIVHAAETPHETGALAAALRQEAEDTDLIVVFGASAIADRRDVIPAAIEAAGGVVEHFGMPVDPGNLLLVGRIGAVPVVGAPGCARSPAENGFDWVLARLLGGLAVTRADIAGMGVGGLLMEIVQRGQPRSGVPAHADTEES
jgi:molybdenum cofactor cytidylyltransferase